MIEAVGVMAVCVIVLLVVWGLIAAACQDDLPPPNDNYDAVLYGRNSIIEEDYDRF